MFNPGSLMSNCATTVQYKPRLFQPHHSLQMRTFESDNVADTSSYTIEETPTYLLARDEDCENSFHSTADFVSSAFTISVV